MLMKRCPWCRNKIEYDKKYCDECAPKEYQHRKTIETKGRLSSRKWSKVRDEVLLRDRNCCVLCWQNEFLETRNLEVHHIVKRIDDETLMYDPDNCVTVCRYHHEILEKLPPSQQIILIKGRR